MKSNNSPDSKPVKRATKSSATPKASASKSSAPKSTAAKTTSHRHTKASAPAAVEIAEEVIVPVAKAVPVVEQASVVVVTAEPVAVVVNAPSSEDVAVLAHSYFVARNYQHGFAEEDWLRAEKALSAKA